MTQKERAIAQRIASLVTLGYQPKIVGLPSKILKLARDLCPSGSGKSWINSHIPLRRP